jgi:hypothetical protein
MYARYRDATDEMGIGVREHIEDPWSRVFRFVDDDLPLGAMQDFSSSASKGGEPTLSRHGP